MLMLAQNLGMVPAFSENVRRARACDEDDHPYTAVPPRPHPELLQGEEDHFQRHHRRAEQQSESHDEKILWIPDLSGHRTGLYHSLGKLPEPELTHKFTDEAM